MEKNGTGGFTLRELLTVISIIAILAGMAPLGRDLITKERVAGATKVLLADLQRLRVKAMTRDSIAFGVRFESSSSYTLFTFNDCNEDYRYDADTCGGAREEAAATIITLPAAVVAKNSTSGKEFDNDVLLFDRFGSPRSATWAFGWRTIIIQDTGAQWTRCIVVSTSRIREGRGNWDAVAGKYKCVKY